MREKAKLPNSVVYALLVFGTPVSCAIAPAVHLSSLGGSTLGGVLPAWAIAMGAMAFCIALWRAAQADVWVVPGVAAAFMLLALITVGQGSLQPPTDPAAWHGRLVATTTAACAWVCVGIAVIGAFIPPASIKSGK